MDPVLRGLLSGYIRSITIESNVNEPYTIVDPFGEAPKGDSDASSKVGDTIRPRITFEINGTSPLVVAPYGAPDPESRRNLKVAVGAGVVGLAALAAWTLKKRRK